MEYEQRDEVSCIEGKYIYISLFKKCIKVIAYVKSIIFA